MKEYVRHADTRRLWAWRWLLQITLSIVASIGCVRSLMAQRETVARETSNTTRVAEQVLAKHITIALRGVSLVQAVDSISRIAGVVVQYQESKLAAYTKPVSLDVTDMPLGRVLEQALDGTSLRVAARSGGRLTVVETTVGADSTPAVGVIAGRVVDSATGRGMNGAVIKVVGTKLTVMAQDSGRFVLQQVPAGDQMLTIKLFGYRPAEHTVTVRGGERAIVQIALVSVPNMLTGVVTTAVGDFDRRSIGNDITVINADSVMRTAPIRTVTDLLETRVPGLTVTHTSGVPGASSRLRLRGVGGGLVPGATNTNNDPIVIVDGMRIYARQSTQRDQNGAAGNYTTPSAIDQIDPNSIDKIEVFKGPSASSLYGSDAANGVIVITTKQGHAGPPTVRATADAGLQYLPGRYAGPGYYNFGHTRENEGTSLLCGGVGQRQGGLQCIRDSLVVFQALSVPRLSMTGVGNNAAASVTAEGGASALRYSLTGSASQALGYLRMPPLYQDQYERLNAAPVPAWMKRPDTYHLWSGTGAFMSMPVPALELRFTTSLASSDQQQSSAQSQLAALSSIYIDTATIDSAALARINAYVLRVTSHELTTNNALGANFSRWIWFPIRADFGLNTMDRQDQATQERNKYLSRGSYTYARPTSQTRTLSTVGRLLPDRSVTISLGVNTTKTTTQDFAGAVDSLLPGVAIPSAFARSSQATTSLTTGGWFIEPRFNGGNRFFFSPGFRIDQSGVSGANGSSQKFGGLMSLFPKMDFSWVAVDREGQQPLLGAITIFRPRVAFGVGGVPPDPTQLYRIYQPSTPLDTSQAPFGGVFTLPYTGVRLTTIGNPILKPERSRELEGGGDLQLWNNRLTLSATTYYRLRLDAIQSVPVAPSAGGGQLSQFRNIGTIRNSGVELQWDAILLENARTKWTVSGNYATNHNTVVSLNGNRTALDFGNGIRIVRGYPLDGRWDRPIVGYTMPDSGQKASISNVVVGDSVVYLGSAQPNYELPVRSSLWLFGGAVNVNVGLNYEHGFTQFASGSAQLLTNLYQDPNASLGQQIAAIAAWCKLRGISESFANTQNEVPTDCRSLGTLSGVVQTVNVLRLNTFSINYNLPARFTQRLRLPPTAIAVQGSNLGLWTSYRGKDPDVNGTPVGEAIQDDGQVPLPRTWGFRVTLN